MNDGRDMQAIGPAQGCREQGDAVPTAPDVAAAEPTLVQIVGAINIVKYRGMYYALPQSLGTIDLHKEAVIGRPGVRVAGSLAGILNIIGQS